MVLGDGRALLEVEEVVKRFGGIRAVDGATMKVREGTITALIGPNGAGKTTLFNVVTGFYRGERGSVTFEGRQVFGEAPTRSPAGGWCGPSRSPRRWPRCR